MANLPTLNSIDVIRKQYPTGEEPVLVMCSDMNRYICKYIHNSASAQKLACELIGVKMAEAWGLNVPKAVLVNIKPEHWPTQFARPKVMTTMLGSKYLETVEYVLPSTFNQLAQTSSMFNQLLKIALFDFWVANEDRNANNSNLLYDIKNARLVPIDFGCILNSADFDFSMMQLTSTDTILYSPLFRHLVQNVSEKSIQELRNYYDVCLSQCRSQVDSVIEDLPSDWIVPAEKINGKLNQLFEPDWTVAVWSNFVECLNDNINNYEQIKI